VEDAVVVEAEGAVEEVEEDVVVAAEVAVVDAVVQLFSPTSRSVLTISFRWRWRRLLILQRVEKPTKYEIVATSIVVARTSFLLSVLALACCCLVLTPSCFSSCGCNPFL
jgi:hypothetical protein